MRKLWLVFWNEYRYHVFRWRFLGVLLSPPLMLVFMIALMAVMLWFSFDHSPVGIVDQAGFFDAGLPQTSGIMIPGVTVQFQLYPSDSAARAALNAKQINAYYIFPPDFREKRQVDVFFTSKPEITVTSQLDGLVRRQYLRAFPTERAALLAGGPTIVLQSLATSGTDSPLGALPESTLAVARMVIPFSAGFFVFLALGSSTGYLSHAIADEKANRTIEILVTSVSAEQLMTGKIIALVSVGLTQILFWFSAPALLAVIAVANGLNLERLYPGGLGALAALLSMALPSLLIYATLIVIITISFGDPREGEQAASFVYFFCFAPVFLYRLFMVSPNGTLPVVLSFFPLTTLISMIMRAAFTTLPAWQIVVGWGSQVVGVVVMFWLASKAFRASMLRFGEPIFSKAKLSALWKRAWPGHFRRTPASKGE